MPVTLFRSAVVGIASLALAAAASAATISAQLTGGQFTGTSAALLPTQTAGFSTFAAPNYNVFDRDNPGGDGNIDSQVLAGVLVQDNGGVVGATTSLLNTTGFTQVTLTGSSNSTPNEKLFKHSFGITTGQSGNLTVSNLAANGFGNYSLIVYLTNGFEDRGQKTATLSVNGAAATTVYVNGILTDANNPLVFHNAFDPASNDISGGVNQDQNGNINYAIFTGLSGDLSLTLAGVTAGKVGIAGFQIQSAVPEPTTLTFLGLGGLTLLRRRR